MLELCVFYRPEWTLLVHFFYLSFIKNVFPLTSSTLKMCFVTYCCLKPTVWVTHSLISEVLVEEGSQFTDQIGKPNGIIIWWLDQKKARILELLSNNNNIKTMRHTEGSTWYKVVSRHKVSCYSTSFVKMLELYVLCRLDWTLSMYFLSWFLFH